MRLGVIYEGSPNMLVDAVRLSLARDVYAMFYHCANRVIVCGVEARSVFP